MRRPSLPMAEPPRGFGYRPDFLAPEGEQALLGQLAQLAFDPVVMHGVKARREVLHFGVGYRYGGGEVMPAPPIPPFLAETAARMAAAARFPPEAQLELLVSRYPPGAGIGWHRDAPPFGPVVAGLSLGAPCELRLRLAGEEGFLLFRTELAPRSLYLLCGTARFRWQHSIPPVAALRYSVTLRTVKSGAGGEIRTTLPPRGAAQ